MENVAQMPDCRTQSFFFFVICKHAKYQCWETYFACHQHSDYKLLKTASSKIPAGRGLRIYPNVRLGFIIGAGSELHIREA